MWAVNRGQKANNMQVARHVVESVLLPVGGRGQMKKAQALADFIQSPQIPK